MPTESLINMKENSIIGIYGGSFNPPHLGHILVAKDVLDYPEIKEVWFMVSPQNPLKKNYEVKFEDRFKMVSLMLEGEQRLIPCDIEKKLPGPPWYTSETMRYLRETWPSQEFALIIGEDCIENFKRWKNWEELIQNHRIYVHRRNYYPTNTDNPLGPNSTWISGESLMISSSELRECFPEKKVFYNPKVYDYILEHHLYEPDNFG